MFFFLNGFKEHKLPFLCETAKLQNNYADFELVKLEFIDILIMFNNAV